MKIVLLGSGNVATHLGIALKKAGNELLQVWSRNLEHARELALKLGSGSSDNLSAIDTSADIYIISIVDDAIAEIAHHLPAKNKVIVHTSGSTELRALDGTSNKVGVIYPLQTFSKTKSVDFSVIPIAIEANSREVLIVLEALAKQISNTVLQINSRQRQALHVAAVFACNFSNHLYTIARQILHQNNLDFDLMKALIAETAAKIQYLSPEEAQTGPAIRQDYNTINKHRKFLENNPHLLDLYDKLSQSIIKS